MKIKLACAASFLALGATPPATAASFDCARASTRFEKTICSDPTLNAADERMGQSYRSALSTFPVKGFVRANQQRFLLTYRTCDVNGIKSCRSVIEDRIAYLDSMGNSVVFSNQKPGEVYNPDNGVLWLKTQNNITVLRYFGGYMPDMNTPNAFPEGFVCDDAAALRWTGAGWAGVDERDQIVVSETGVKASISCSSRNGLNGNFARVTVPESTKVQRATGVEAPLFKDPSTLIIWLIQHSGRGFQAEDDSASSNVFSPGLRAALRATYRRSRQLNEPPCGANGDILRDTQEDGVPANLRVSGEMAGPDRVTVSATFDIDGYHRERRYQTVRLEGAWKLENIVEADGSSLRRSLDCRR